MNTGKADSGGNDSETVLSGSVPQPDSEGAVRNEVIGMQPRVDSDEGWNVDEGEAPVSKNGAETKLRSEEGTHLGVISGAGAQLPASEERVEESEGRVQEREGRVQEREGRVEDGHGGTASGDFDVEAHASEKEARAAGEPGAGTVEDSDSEGGSPSTLETASNAAAVQIASGASRPPLSRARDLELVEADVVLVEERPVESDVALGGPGGGRSRVERPELRDHEEEEEEEEGALANPREKDSEPKVPAHAEEAVALASQSLNAAQPDAGSENVRGG